VKATVAELEEQKQFHLLKQIGNHWSNEGHSEGNLDF